ncbi:MAG: hypothetical protein ACXACI_13065 [Candidatus Hodarchaeales archaeon]|jgi:hypothetical protein
MTNENAQTLQYTTVTENIITTAMSSDEVDHLVRPYQTSRMSCVALPDELFFIDCTARADLAQQFRTDMETRFERPTTHLLLSSEDWHRAFGMQAFKDVTVVIASPGKAFFKKSLKDKYIDTIKEYIYREIPEDEELREVLLNSSVFIPQIGVSKRTFGPKTHPVIFQKLPHSGARASWLYLPSEKTLFLGRALSSCSVALHWPINTPELFRQWEQLDVAHVIPGNGPVVGKDYITQIREYYEALLEKLYESKQSGLKEKQLIKRTDLPEWPGKKRKSWIEGSPYHTRVVTNTIRYWYRQVLREPTPADEDLQFIS